MPEWDSYDIQRRNDGAMSRWKRRAPVLAISMLLAGLALFAVGGRSLMSAPNGPAPAVASEFAMPSLGARALPVGRAQAEGGASEDNGTIQRAFVLTSLAAAAESEREQRGVFTYTVKAGDTLFGIALAFGLAPETVLWSNYKELKDDPDLLSIGQELLIPPADGLIVEVEPGDTIEALARRFKATPSVIAGEPANGLASANQQLLTGQVVFVRGGSRETVLWQVPKPVEVSRNPTTGVRVYRVGVCGEVAIPPLGTGRFGYPANARTLSGYNYSAWHPGLDFAGRLGNPIYAADSGTVIYAGYSLNAAGQPVGYGQYVVLDHGNGYQTLYAHASQLYVKCGQQVLKGAVIAAVGSVGRSTGPHLHFEIRNNSVAVNPWNLLR